MQKWKPCSCDAGCPECTIGPFQRNHYFTGKLLVERDFRQEQDYYVDKFKHHHQRLHGSGVVCGLKVVQHESPPCRARFLCVEPGTAIDCCGREIVVRERECVDITKLPQYKKLTQPSTMDLRDFQLCIKYRECPTEDIPVLYDDCGCNDAACAPNRILESYEFDLILDPPTGAPSPNAPKVEWTNTLFNITDVFRVALHDASRRLYVLTATNPNVVYQLNLDNNVVLAPLVLPSRGLDVAVSPDGSRLYVALEAAPLRQLLVVDTSTFTPVRTIDIPDSGGSPVELTCGSDGHLYGLVNLPGRLQRWDLDINTNVVPAPAPLLNVVLVIKAEKLVLSTDSARAYALDSPNRIILSADTATGMALTPINILPATATPSSLALVRSGGQDELAVGDAGPTPRIYLVNVALAALRGSSKVSHRPVDIVATPDGRWAFVLVRDTTAHDFVQPVNLSAIRTGLSVAPGVLTPVGDQTQELEINVEGTLLFAPYLGSQPNSVQDGSLAILEMTGQACCEKFWDSLNGCPSCDTGDCVVLASVRNYRPGFQMLDLPGAANDIAGTITRIDNRDGRVLLPSTQVLAEVIRCLCESDSGTGTDGQPGADGQPGTNGQDGIGLNPNLPKILDIGWLHGSKTLSWTDFRKNLIYDANPNEVVKRWPDVRPLLTVYFNNPMRNIDRETFRVSLQHPQSFLVQSQTGATGPVFSGLYNLFNLDVYGYLLSLPKPAGHLTPHTGEDYQSAWAFIPDHNIFLNPSTRLLIEGGGWLSNANFDLDPLSVHVTLKGDFLWAGKAGDSFSEDRMLDADNYGGRVGLNITRSGLVTGGKNPSGDMVIGGDFESWFFLTRPTDGPAGDHFDMTHLRQGLGFLSPFRGIQSNANMADRSELVALTESRFAGLADRIVKERKRRPFRNLSDFSRRLKLDDQQASLIEPLLAFE